MFTTGNWNEDERMRGQRLKLIAELRRKGIATEAVLSAIARIPRQWFFPKDFEQFVYRDAAFPIGHGQTISQPYTVAFQTELLAVNPGEKVLEIGTGSGYQAAVLWAMGVQVYSVEVVRELLAESSQVLKKLDSNIKLFHGDGTLGLPAEAPFDAILVTAGAPEVPETYVQQLKVGGRLVIPVGSRTDNQQMLRVTKISDHETKTEVFGNFRFVPLLGEKGWKN